jgi:hypothetical protein
MDEFVHFGTRTYGLCLLALAFGRGMDLLSTWVATPNLALEGNPVAKKLGWRWGIVVNIVVTLGVAFWPFPAVSLATTSLLVAARNFQSAWLMRGLGEHAYREWYVQRLEETPVALYLFCLLGQTLLVAAVGAALIYFGTDLLMPVSIGLGLICYSAVVLFYTLLAMWRRRRAYNQKIAQSQHVLTDP